MAFADAAVEELLSELREFGDDWANTLYNNVLKRIRQRRPEIYDIATFFYSKKIDLSSRILYKEPSKEKILELMDFLMEDKTLPRNLDAESIS